MTAGFHLAPSQGYIQFCKSFLLAFNYWAIVTLIKQNVAYRPKYMCVCVCNAILKHFTLFTFHKQMLDYSVAMDKYYSAIYCNPMNRRKRKLESLQRLKPAITLTHDDTSQLIHCASDTELNSILLKILNSIYNHSLYTEITLFLLSPQPWSSSFSRFPRVVPFGRVELFHVDMQHDCQHDVGIAAACWHNYLLLCCSACNDQLALR